jgi:hypothetical protein
VRPGVRGGGGDGDAALIVARLLIKAKFSISVYAPRYFDVESCLLQPKKHVVFERLKENCKQTGREGGAAAVPVAWRVRSCVSLSFPRHKKESTEKAFP